MWRTPSTCGGVETGMVADLGSRVGPRQERGWSGSLDRVIPAELAAMGEARECVEAHCRDVLPEAKLADAILLTSELVANAVRHADADEGEGVGLEVDVRPDAVHVSVIDSGSGFDRTAVKIVDGIGGWGLTVVEKISDGWGNEMKPNGSHRVWFEIAR